MTSFNIAKMSWQKNNKNDSIDKVNEEVNLLNRKINNIREKKKLKEKNENKKKDIKKNEQVFTHFSGLRKKFISEKKRYS
jgi:DNA-binding transcriptional regulator GbsR (MarR family)